MGPLIALVQAVVVAAPTLDAPRLTVTPEDYLVGSVTLRATLEPADAPIAIADFSVDGVVVCRLEKPPLICAFDAGQEAAARRVRVAVTLKNGARVTAGFESKGMTLNEAVSVRNVLVPVVVWDWRGRFLSGLTKESFQIYEDGVAQPIELFMTENVPLELTLALDVSESMGPILDRVKVEAKEFLSKLKPSDRVNLVAFNQRVYTLARSEATPQARALAIDRLKAEGGTAIFDAIMRGVSVLGYHMSRRAMIVFTDGKDEHSITTLDALDTRLSSSDVLLYVITYGRGAELQRAREPLDRLAEASGGRGYGIKDIDDLREVFSGILDHLSQHYLLSYAPTKSELDGSFRTISVKLAGKRDREYTVKARAGYRASPPN